MIFGLFKKKSLNDHLTETRKVKLRGVLFEIRRIDMSHYLEGSKVLVKWYGTLEDKKNSKKETERLLDEGPSEKDFETIRKMYRDIFVCAVVSPSLTRDPEKEPLKHDVEELFTDFDMCHELYAEIGAFTYGKKKLRSNT